MNLVKKIYAFKLSTNVLRAIIILFMVAGLAGTMIQNSILGMNSLSNYQLFEKMQNDSDMMVYATVSLIFQFLEACAIPIFSLLLVERVAHMGSPGKCLVWILGLATACQFLYNRISTGSLIVTDWLNPVFSLVMSMIMLYFFCRFTEKRARNTALKVTAVVFVFLWSNILGISHGAACVFITAVLWTLRGK